MAEIKWYRWSIRKYRNSTRVLALSCLAAHGAYRNLLDAYMEKGNLPRDRRALWKLAIAPSQADYEMVADEVEAMFVVSDCGTALMHDTADAERRDAAQKMEETSAVRSEAGSKGAARRWQPDSKPIAKPSQVIAHDTTEHNTTKPKPTAGRAAPMPHDFKVTPEHRYWALERGLPSPDDHIEHFRQFWMSNGKKKLDWNATFRVWLINSKDKYGATNGRKAQVNQDQQRDDFRQMAAAIDGKSGSETTIQKQHLLANTGAKTRGDGGLVSISSADREGEIH